MKKKPTFAKKSLFENVNPTPVDAYMGEQTQTHEYEHEHIPPKKKKELYDRRINLMLKPSTTQALDALAAEQEISRNELIRDIIENFLNKN